MLTFVAEHVRSRLTDTGRQRVRAIVDPMLSPIGTIKRSARSTGLIALTFDDGPDPVVTVRLLDLLADRHLQATFFILTEKAQTMPDIIRRIRDGGHELALHGDRHDRLTALPVPEVRRRLKAARTMLEQLSETRIHYFRPPFGAQTLSTFLAARSVGLQVVGWGPYAEDWIERTPESAASRALRGTRGGDIVLFHDGLEVPEGEMKPTFDRIRMIEFVLQGLEERGLRPTTVGKMITASGARRTAWFRA